MIPGLRGSLLSHDAIVRLAGPAASGGGRSAPDALRELSAWHRRVRDEAGPTWPARLVFDRIATPVCAAFGYDIVPAGGSPRLVRAVLRRDGSTDAAMTAFAWGQDGGTTWRESVRAGLDAGVRWCYCFAGPWLRVYDAERTHSRWFAEFDLEALIERPDTFATAWAVLTGAAALDVAVARSEQHRADVRDSLQAGVHGALTHLTRAFAASTPRARSADGALDLLDESLVVVYRILFLLFAEARGMVPSWHPVFRESYTLEALRGPVERLPRPRGLWAALQAISRLAHRGCAAGTLRVPAYNGRLFSPAGAPLADTVRLDDAAVRDALLALTTRPTRSGRERIAYGDLGVEQLGGVYERVLDYDLSRDAGRVTLVRGGRRKATGTFYTPRSLTEYVVRRTLAPLVEGAPPERILALRVLDPSMGSGAFLVGACRYLARAYETALLEQGGVSPSDLDEADRAGFRRLVAQKCLYGVDVNPMSVQLARLSLWLTTFAGDRPLTFFDHHLRTGNSLVGADLDAIRRGRPGRRRRPAAMPLLDEAGLDAAIGGTVGCHGQLRDGPEETLEQVRAKERLFAGLQDDASPIARWKGIADLWCAGWFDPDLGDMSGGVFRALVDGAGGSSGSLPRSVEESLLARAKQVAGRERFFHWELEFPDLFRAPDGRRLPIPGFDAIVGNPPWEMVRGDTGDAAARARAAKAGSALTRFARDSGIYRLHGAGHANLYQMFVERALSLLRPGGRLGLVLPFGIASDHGCAALRRHLFDTAAIDGFVVIENRDRLFPIHRSLKFVSLTLTTPGTPTARATELPLRAGVVAVRQIDRLPDLGPDPEAVPVSMRLIERLSGEQLAVPELRTEVDARIVARLAYSAPACGDADGWALRFGRELNASDDRRHFNGRGDGLPVIEGKHIRPFAADVAASRQFVRRATAHRLLGGRPFDHARVAYRDVSSATNRLTLIAAVLPPGTVTTHTLFCLKSQIDEEAQHFIAGMFNSFVANYLVRLRVTTHVTVSIIERLPVPMPPRSSREFRLVAAHARLLSASAGGLAEQAGLQAAAARLYGLDREAFAHVLSTFPLVDGALRAASLAALPS